MWRWARPVKLQQNAVQLSPTVRVGQLAVLVGMELREGDSDYARSNLGKFVIRVRNVRSALKLRGVAPEKMAGRWRQ